MAAAIFVAMATSFSTRLWKALNSALGKGSAEELNDKLNALGADGSGAFTTLSVSGASSLADASASTLSVTDLTVDDGSVTFQFSTESSLTFSIVGDAGTKIVTTVTATAITETVTSATGEYSTVLTANLADSYSITDGVGDLIVFDTRTGARVLTLMGGVAADSVQVGGVASAKVGFYAVAPVTRATAFTQTYATADKTHANPTAAALTVTDGAGTNDGTIGAITADASVIAAVQELADQIAKLVADDADTKQLVNSVIDDLQALGLLS